MTKQQSTRERMLKKLEQRKQEQALQNQMRSQNTPPVNYSLEQTEKPNNLVFRLPEQGNQEKQESPQPEESTTGQKVAA
jgi:hypothetical protein